MPEELTPAQKAWRTRKAKAEAEAQQSKASAGLWVCDHCSSEYQSPIAVSEVICSCSRRTISQKPRYMKKKE